MKLLYVLHLQQNLEQKTTVVKDVEDLKWQQLEIREYAKV